MRRLPALAVAVLALLVATAPAGAHAKAKPKPVTKAASGTLKITLQNVGGPRDLVLAGARWRVHGLLTPYVAGQKVTVRFYRAGHKIAAVAATVSPAANGHAGVFNVDYSTVQTGTVLVGASHKATKKLKAVTAQTTSVVVLPTHISPGATGATVRALQHLLEAEHFAVQTSGVYDQRTGRGVLGFQKLVGLPRTSIAGPATMRKLVTTQPQFKIRFPGQGKHIEASLSHQLIALINRRGQVYRLYPVSSGKPSTPTILGTFHVYSKTPGYNSEGMFFSSYFIRGYAIHGFDPSPNYAASHGCLRTWIPDAIAIYNWIAIGDPVDVYQ